jgi:hypothetical protein
MARPINPHTGPKPTAWIYKDPFDHERHIPYLRWRAQCVFRKEAVDLPIEDWFELWKDPKVWANRGRHSSAYVLKRINDHEPWSYVNCVIITRREHIQMIRAEQTLRK